ncbi:type IV pilin-like G/H family protein [Microcoleus sp. N9_B2]|uniref:type IV pilin-like G/H family protein n=1 Tax=unclassified Microcoleus TaxID=2642155 RepID=UPI002FD05F2D
MQLKEKPELNQINQKSEASVKTYQPDRPIKEPKSVARVDIQPKEKPELNQINEQSKFLAKTYQPDRPIKEPKSVARVDRTNLQPIKEPKSVARVDRQNLWPIKKLKSVAKTYQPDLRSINEYKSRGGTSRIIDFFVVVIIIGILSAIALPEFARCKPYKAMQSEAKQYVSSMNKGQQAYFAENSAFGNSISALGLGIKTQTTNYNYSAIATKNAAFSYGVARNNNLRSYVGAILFVHQGDAMTTISILCEADSPGKIKPANPILQNNVPVCAAGSSEVSK